MSISNPNGNSSHSNYIFSKNTMVILRGISGSGKSTLASKLLESNEDSIHLTSDDYFINLETGEYNFFGAKLPYAHEWNQDRARRALKKGIKVVIIDNTNTQKWEAKPYVSEAISHGYEVQFIEPDTPWKLDAEILSKKNQHGVPIEKIREMINRYEKDFSIENILKSKSPHRPNIFKPFDMVQIILTKESKNLLLSKVEKKYISIIGSHITLAFKPNAEYFNNLKNKNILEKDLVQIETDLLVWSDKIGVETLRVKNMINHLKDQVESLNAVPHITISLNPKIANPVDSNKLLEMKDSEIQTKNLELNLMGYIHFLRFKNQR